MPVPALWPSSPSWWGRSPRSTESSGSREAECEAPPTGVAVDGAGRGGEVRGSAERVTRRWLLEGLLVRHLVALQPPPESGQLRGDRRNVDAACENAHRCLPAVELRSDADAVAAVELQALVVQRSDGRAADQPDSHGARAEEEQGGPDAGALAEAPGTDLVLLQETVRIQGEDPDGVAVGGSGRPQVGRRGIGGGLVVEDAEDQRPLTHRSLPFTRGDAVAPGVSGGSSTSRRRTPRP